MNNIVNHIIKMWTLKLSKLSNYEDFFINTTRVEGLFVSKELISNGHSYRTFKHFKNISIFLDFVKSVEKKKRNFHEIIPSGPQKLKFDVDAYKDSIAFDACEVVRSIVISCKKIFKSNYNISLKKENFVVFDSTGCDKYSYHLVISGYHVNDHRSAKVIANTVYQKINQRFQRYVDMGIYSSCQSFRLPYCNKYCSTRFKQPVDYPSDVSNIRSKEFKKMLITHLTSDSVLVFVNCVKIDREKVHLRHSSDIEQILKRVRDTFGSFPFKIKNIKKDLIELERIESSFCPSCMRIHDRENSYVYEEKTLVKSAKTRVYWVCRRNNKPILCLDKIKSSFVSEIGIDPDDLEY